MLKLSEAASLGQSFEDDRRECASSANKGRDREERERETESERVLKQRESALERVRQNSFIFSLFVYCLFTF